MWQMIGVLAELERSLITERTRAGSGNAANGIVTVAGIGGRDEGEETGAKKSPPDPHYRRRFPAEIISHAVWLYHVFSPPLCSSDHSEN
jgi:DNA invertase Pin-like site-specific DNA recombinase